MKITNVKAMVAKMFTVGLLAGAVVIAAPNKAQAQVSFGVRVGPVYGFRPAYVAPRYVAPSPIFYGPGFGYDRAAWFRHQEWERHEAFAHRGFYR
jgi:hypothetical protein